MRSAAATPTRRRWPARATPGAADRELAAARRGARLVGVTRDWVWPRWLERRLDPSSPDAAPVGPLGLLVNDAHRRWTSVGVLDGAGAARVDPCGLITPAHASWSLDWWIGGDDRWHLPSREAAVRQHRNDVGVVHTAVRIPSGDAVSRVFGVRLTAADGGGAALVLEVENASAAPFALALAVRPVTPDGVGVLRRAGCDERGLTVDGRRAALFAKRPAHAAASDLAHGDVAGVVFAGLAGVDAATADCPEGMAQAVALVPVAHRATVRFVLPLDWSGPDALPEAFPGGLPPADRVAAGWASQLDRGVRIEPPDASMARVSRTALHRVLLAGTSLAAGGPAEVDALGLVLMAEALLRRGFADEAGRLLLAWLEAQGPDGSLPVPGAAPASGRDVAGTRPTELALWGLARHWLLCRDPTVVEAAAPAVLAASHHLLARHAVGSAVDLGWRRAALAGSRLLLGAAGDHRNARAVGAAGSDVDGHGERRRDGHADGAAGSVRVTRDDVAELLPAAALGILDARDPILDAAFAILDGLGGAEERAAAPTLHPGRGADPALGFAAAAVAAARADLGAAAAVRELMELAAPSGSWPTRSHPRTGEGCAGSGDDVAVAACALLAVDGLLVRETGAGVELCPSFDPGWYGRGAEVHGLRSVHGLVSFAVRWHGARPALLWEITPHGDAGLARAPVVRAPGLDPGWSGRELRGEALLGEPPAAAGAEHDHSGHGHSGHGHAGHGH